MKYYLHTYHLSSGNTRKEVFSLYTTKEKADAEFGLLKGKMKVLEEVEEYESKAK